MIEEKVDEIMSQVSGGIMDEIIKIINKIGPDMREAGDKGNKNPFKDERDI